MQPIALQIIDVVVPDRHISELGLLLGTTVGSELVGSFEVVGDLVGFVVGD